MSTRVPRCAFGGALTSMRNLIVAFGVALAFGAAVAYADGSCSYQGTDHLNGSDVCREGIRYRCENGLWHNLNMQCALQAVLAEAGCEYQGQPFASGRANCQDGTLYRCDSGRWQSLRTPCGEAAVIVYSGFIPFSVNGKGCLYRGAQFDAQSTMCKGGTTLMCESGEWTDLRAPCR